MQAMPSLSLQIELYYDLYLPHVTELTSPLLGRMLKNPLELSFSHS